jgi:hypothetical protein
LIEGDDELAESLQADVTDVAQRGIHNGGIGKFVATSFNHVTDG